MKYKQKENTQRYEGEKALCNINCAGSIEKNKDIPSQTKIFVIYGEEWRAMPRQWKQCRQ